MKLTKKIILALGVLATGAGYAQTATTTRTASGLLGHRYTELSLGAENIDHLSSHGYSVGASANNPVIPGVLDAGASYGYSWIRGPFKGHANTVGAYATAYTPLAGVRPFATAALGYQWTSARFGAGDDEAIWGAAIGVEIPAGVVTVTPRISYADDFDSDGRAWTTSVEVNYWYSRTSAVYTSLGRTDVRRSPFDSWNWEIGLRARF
jgi:hypothetical protein